MTDLGTLGDYNSRAVGINDAGQIVGNLATSWGIYHPFIYTNGAIQDLNSLIAPSSGWELMSVSSINNQGQIAGYGTINGLGHAFVLKATTSVSEPASLALFGMAALALLRRRRHTLA